MRVKNFEYSLAGHCIKRVQAVDKPKAIPVPKNIIPNLTNIVAVKGGKQDVDSEDEEVDCFKGSSIPCDNIETKAMTKFKKLRY